MSYVMLSAVKSHMTSICPFLFLLICRFFSKNVSRYTMDCEIIPYWIAHFAASSAPTVTMIFETSRRRCLKKRENRSLTNSRTVDTVSLSGIFSPGTCFFSFFAGGEVFFSCGYPRLNFRVETLFCFCGYSGIFIKRIFAKARTESSARISMRIRIRQTNVIKSNNASKMYKKISVVHLL